MSVISMENKDALSSFESLSPQERYRRQVNLVRASLMVPVQVRMGDHSAVYGGLESKRRQLATESSQTRPLSGAEVEEYMQRSVFGDINQERDEEVLEALPLLPDDEIWRNVQHLNPTQKLILGSLAGVQGSLGETLTKDSLVNLHTSYQTSSSVDNALQQMEKARSRAAPVPQFWNKENVEAVKNALYDYSRYASQIKFLKDASRGQFAIEDSRELTSNPLSDRENFNGPYRMRFTDDSHSVHSHVELSLKPESTLSLENVIKRNRQPGEHPKFRIFFSTRGPSNDSPTFYYEIDSNGVIKSSRGKDTEREEIGRLDCSSRTILKIGSIANLSLFPKREGQTLLDKKSPHSAPLLVSDVKLILEEEFKIEEQNVSREEEKHVPSQVIARDVDSRRFDTGSLPINRNKLVCDKVVDFWSLAKDYSGHANVLNAQELRNLPLSVVQDRNLTFICQPGYEYLVRDIAKWKDQVNHFNGSTLVPDESRKPVAILLAGNRYVQRMAATTDGSTILLNGDAPNLSDSTRHEFAHGYLGPCCSPDLTEGFALLVERYSSNGTFDISKLGGYSEMRALGMANLSPGGSHTQAFENRWRIAAGEGHEELSYSYGLTLVESLLWSGLCDYDKLVKVCRSAGDDIFSYREVGDNVKLFMKTANGEREVSTREVNSYALQKNGIDPQVAEYYLDMYNRSLHRPQQGKLILP